MAFDWVRCYYPLPNEEAQNLIFTTQSLGGQSRLYEVSHEGKLLLTRHPNNRGSFAQFDTFYHGLVKLYGKLDFRKDIVFFYRLKFVEGKVISIQSSTILYKAQA